MATATKRTVAKPPKKKKTLGRSTRTARDSGTVKFDASGKPKLKAIQVTDIHRMGHEPEWTEQDSWDEVQRRIQMSRAFTWYNYSCDHKDARAFFEAYCATTEELAHYTAKFKGISDSQYPTTTGWLCRMIMSGFQLKNDEERYIHQLIAKLEDSATTDKSEISDEAVPVVKKETIQDRLAEKFSEAMGEVEGAIDDYILEGKEFSAYKFFQGQNISVQYIAKAAEVIQPKINELNELLEGRDSQLMEGYKHMSKRDVKALIKFYEAIINDASAYKTSKIATRAKPKRKPVPPERQVKGLKYLREFAELGLKSINPTEILEMSELWTYNTKTRKLGRFVVAMHGDMVVGQLGVKGSAIIGFDEIKSTCKTLRKPAEKLAEFKTQGKPGLRKFMDTIRSVETRLKGRISPETILLRAIK